MQNDWLKAQNIHLTELLKQAGVDAARRDVAERIQAVLTGELHHRMKNMLTLVTALVRQSMRSAVTLEEAERAIGARLIAMGKAHDLLLEADGRTAKLTNVIRGAIGQHSASMQRITFDGDEIEVAADAIVPITLVLNELCTNATKYGALSNDEGRVALKWQHDPKEKRTSFRWIEAGGPPVLPPKAKSFGTRLIEEALPRQLGGTGRLTFAPSGVEFDFIVPDAALLPLDTA